MTSGAPSMLRAMRTLKTGIKGARLEALLGVLVSVALGVLPVIANADWKSTAGAMTGAVTVAGIVGVRLLGHQKWDRLVADRGPVIAADLIRAGEILKSGLPIPASPIAVDPPEPASPAEVEALGQLDQVARIELDDQLGFAEHPASAELIGDTPIDPDKGDARSAAAKAAA